MNLTLTLITSRYIFRMFTIALVGLLMATIMLPNKALAADVQVSVSGSEGWPTVAIGGG